MKLRRLMRSPGRIPVLLVAAVLGGLLVGYEPVGGDPDRIYRPIKQVLGESLRQGRLPYWSDRFGVGVPLLAESHAGALYPPNWLLYSLLDTSTAYRLSMWAHYALMAASTYAYARKLGLAADGAGLAGVAFALCGFQSIQSSHEWAYQTLAYLPLCLLMAEGYARTGKKSWLAGLAMCWGVQLTLGHFQVQMWTGGLSLAAGAWSILAGRRPKLRLLLLPIGLAWGAAIAAMQLAPTWELATIVGQTRRAYAELAFYSYPPAHWPELAVPRLFRAIAGGPEDSYWFRQSTTGYEACFYVGTIPLIFAFVGFLNGRGLWFWRCAVAGSLALATMPRWWPAGYAAVLSAPGLGYFRCPARYTAVSSLGLALLAGAGFDRAIGRRRFAASAIFSMIFAGAAMAFGAWWSRLPEHASSLGDNLLQGRIGMAAVGWVVGLLAVVSWRAGRTRGVWLVTLAAVELGLLYYDGTTRWGRAAPLPGSSWLLRAMAERPGGGKVGGGLDNLPVRAGRSTASSYFGFPMPPPNDLLAAANDRRALADPAARRWLRRLGVAEVVWDRAAPVYNPRALGMGPDPVLDLLARREPGEPSRREWSWSRVDDPFPAARAATRARVVDRPTLLRTLGEADRRDEASYLPADAPADNSPRATSATVASWDGATADVDHDGTCDLIILRTFYPGWRATIAGIETPIRPVDGGLQGVRLAGRGRSTVVFAYRPTGGRTAGAIAGVALAGAIAAIAAGRRARVLT